MRTRGLLVQLQWRGPLPDFHRHSRSLQLSSHLSKAWNKGHPLWKNLRKLHLKVPSNTHRTFVHASSLLFPMLYAHVLSLGNITHGTVVAIPNQTNFS
ncbi:Hypothetical protein CPI37_1420 [Corynebacterium pseudotuberculosis]|nr:Hypothetical protein CPI37_1420 [Corynebacterium pseudotuberculosis]